MIILILSILLFGAMHTYVYTLMGLGTLVATALVFWKSIRKDYKTGIYLFRFPKTSLNIFFLIFLLFLVLQTIPLPEFLVDFLSPESKIVGDKSLSASSLVGQGRATKSWFTLSPYLYPVRLSILRFTVYGLFFLGLIKVLNSKKRIDLAVLLILITGCFETLYGFMQTYSGSEHIWWFKKQVHIGSLTGSYINRNHFAGFMGMGLFLAAAFSLGLSPRKAKNHGRRSRKKQTLASKISELLSREEELTKRILIAFTGVVMGIALIFSTSRGGMISAAGGMFLMGMLFSFRKEYRKKGVFVLVLFALIAAYAVKIGVENPMKRFKTFNASFEQREALTKKTMEMFGNYAFSGVGVGNFQYAYPKYQGGELFKKRYVRFAHNDWAQFLSEAGIVGMGLLLAGIACYIFKTMHLWTRRSDPYAVCLGVVPIVALAYIAVHSYSDFNLHVPANFLVLVAIIAIGYAALHLERHHRRDVMTYRYYELPLRYRGGIVLVLILGLIGWTGYTAIGHFMGEAYCHTVPNSTLNRDKHPPLGEIAKAIEWDPSNAAYWYKLGNRQRSGVGGQRSEVGGQGSERRLPALEQAVSLNPFDAQYHLRLGWEYAHQWKKKDYHTKWLPAADISMDRAAYFAGVKNPHLHQELGNYWTMRSRTVLPNDPLYHEAWAKACWHYHKAQSLETGGALKRMKKEIRGYVWRFYPDEGYVKEVLSVKF